MNGIRMRFTPRERTVLVVLVLYATISLILLTPIKGAIGGEPQATLPPPPTAAAAAPGAERVAPLAALESSQQQRSDEIVATDRSLSAALGGAPHSIVKAGPWTTSGTGGSASRLLGAAYVVEPEKPIALRSAKLPGALYDQTERRNPPYQSVVNEVSADQVTQFLVLVDLARGQVVSITPGPDTSGLESTPPPGFERTVPAPRDGGR